MPTISDLRRQMDNLDRQIVDLLYRRMKLVEQEAHQRSGEDLDTEREEQMLSNWLEEAIDFDLDEASMEKICKAVLEMARKVREV